MHSCTTQKHQVLGNSLRWPGLLLQTAFCRCCKTTKVHFMVLGRIKDCMGYQTAPHSSLGLPCGLYQFMSPAEGTAPLFESEWVLYPAFGSPSAPTEGPATSIQSCTGCLKSQELKKHQKTSSIQAACRNNYKMLATYI